jgi:hypothetical protein
LLLTSTAALGQQWVTYEITNGIEIDFPKEPIVVDSIVGYKKAFVNSGSITFAVSETPFHDIGYTDAIRNADELSAFYDAVTTAIAQNPGITIIQYKSDYKQDLLVRWLQFANEEHPPKTCDLRLLLTDAKLFMIQACTADTALAEQQSRFLVSLNVVSGHNFSSQLEASPEERALQVKESHKRGKAIGYTLAGASVIFLLAWFILYVIMITKTRTTEASMALIMAFTIVRWMTIVILGVLVSALTAALIKNMIAFDYSSIIILVVCGGLGLIIAFLRTPRYNNRAI